MVHVTNAPDISLSSSIPGTRYILSSMIVQHPTNNAVDGLLNRYLSKIRVKTHKGCIPAILRRFFS